MDIYNSKFALLFKPKGTERWAITLGPTTLYSVPQEQVSVSWRKHEECHKRQWKRLWYIGFLVLYLWYHFTKGYQKNPFEIEARKEEQL
ncbi:hypothetical protein [Geobacter sp. SVR]|uniref:hypothetical protein n=1 Tax=Geobacter sp. SVR TaxID=2495594 RepID=UPI00143F03B4|nr:hypothetical protein [Geobacter sp. SVR]BCS53298.1 hypothetical protein GSVR_16060 [Geobacter sp. SVR]GCF85576.1 hypothetical protein GSbR_21760 [Geobacter sp. SVR]